MGGKLFVGNESTTFGNFRFIFVVHFQEIHFLIAPLYNISFSKIAISHLENINKNELYVPGLLCRYIIDQV